MQFGMNPVFALGFLLDGDVSAVDVFIVMMVVAAAFGGVVVGMIGQEESSRLSPRVAIAFVAGLFAGLIAMEIGIATIHVQSPVAGSLWFIAMLVAFAATAMFLRMRLLNR